MFAIGRRKNGHRTRERLLDAAANSRYQPPSEKHCRRIGAIQGPNVLGVACPTGSAGNSLNLLAFVSPLIYPYLSHEPAPGNVKIDRQQAEQLPLERQ